MHGGVDERLHDEEHVRRAGAGNGRGHGHELLVVDLDLFAEAGQQCRRLRALVLGRLRGRDQTVIPFPSRAGVLGIERTTWS